MTGVNIMTDRQISYMIHIAATPEELWSVLTDEKALKACWGIIRSAWSAGAPIAEVSSTGTVLWQGQVQRSDPPRHLSFTFDVAGIDENPTDVSFEIEPPVSKVAPGGSIVRLKVVQSGFAENSKLINDCARAWTEILSSIKSYVETGGALPFAFSTEAAA
jgi:uncharacterized protein YndB with AHSA1/START domain